MISFYDLGPVKVFDGDVAQQKTPVVFNIKGQSVSFVFSDLMSLTELSNIGGNLSFNADDISFALSLPVAKLGSIKIHKGSKQGLKLYFCILDDLLHVFSFGEYQPGRFVCIYEGTVKL